MGSVLIQALPKTLYHHLTMNRKLRFTLYILVGYVCLNAQVPDSTFGEPFSFDDFNGTTRIAVTGVDFDNRNDRCYASFHLSDGRILLVGHTSGIDGTDMAMARLHANGRYDESAGPRGRMRIDLGYPADSILCAAIDAQERIIAAGCARQQGQNGFAILAARTDINGVLDTTFGNNGHVLIDLPSDYEMITQIISMPDGRILVAGEARYGNEFWVPDSTNVFLLRLLPDGQLDPEFGQDGIIQFRFEQECLASVVSDIALDPAGRILVAGNNFHPTPGRKEGELSGCTFQVRLLCFLPEGIPDPTFGSGGWAKVLPSAWPDGIGGLVHAIHVMEDGKILLTGNADPLSFFSTWPAFVFFAKMLPNGTPDLSFGQGGRFMRFIFGAFDIASALDILPLGNHLYIGFEDGDPSFSAAFGLLQFSQAGIWDTISFGTNGRFNSHDIGWLPFYGRHNTHLSATDTNSVFVAGTYRAIALDNMMIAKVKLNTHIVSSVKEAGFAGKIRVFPNPVSAGHLYLNFSEWDMEGLVQLSMHNAQGRSVLQRAEMPTGGVQQLEVSHLPAGMYILEISGRDFRTVEKVIIQR